MTSKEIIMSSTATLKRKLKTADEATAKMIWAELNCRGIYRKTK